MRTGAGPHAGLKRPKEIRAGGITASCIISVNDLLSFRNLSLAQIWPQSELATIYRYSRLAKFLFLGKYSEHTVRILVGTAFLRECARAK